MDAEARDALSDAALDRAIQQALAVDPSPEFLPRVRTAVAGGGTPTAAWRTWPARACLAVAASVAFAIVVSRHETVAPPSSVEPLASRIVLPLAGAGAMPGPPIARALVAREARGTEVRPGPIAAAQRATPEILIDPSEAELLRRLITLMRAGAVDTRSFIKPVRPVTEALDPVAAIRIPPAAVQPLEPSGE